MMNRRARSDLLFYQQGELGNLLQSLKNGIQEEINRLDRDYILKVSEDDLCKHLTSRYTLEAPILHDENKYAHPPQDVDIDISGRFDYAVSREEGPCYVKGTSVTISVPFEGDAQLFHFSSSVYSLSGVRGSTTENEILLNYHGVPQDMTTDKIKNELERDLKTIKESLHNISHQIQAHNQYIITQIKGFISSRKDKILREQNIVAALGIPIKRRDETANTYAIPTVRKKPAIERPKVKEGNFVPEPALPMAEYEHILEIIHNMALVMERSPAAFVNMKEEDLRTHFLVQLNGHYEGLATGETFNYEGKTDILIRFEGRNVFIAECKFWTGEQGLIETIDQLLKYTSWRDTKTAIILFNKNKDFSLVLSKIPEVVKAHQYFKKTIENKSETSFRFVFRQPNDPNKELILTIMAFDIPQIIGKEER